MLATIVNTVGAEVVALDDVTRKNVQAAAVEEFTHYKVLRALGGRPATKKIWVPSAAVASATDFLSTLVVGDQVFINAYLIATQSFGNRGDGKAARSPRRRWAPRRPPSPRAQSRVSSATTGCS